MKATYKNILLLFAAVATLSFNACKDKDNDDDHDDENELITTAKITFTHSVSGTAQTFTWSQPGGPGTAITVDTIRLHPDSLYQAAVTLLDESKNPVSDITEEIKELQDEHQFFYTSGTGRLIISNLDKDSKNLPLGLNFSAQTSTNGNVNGTLKVVLKHYTSAAPKSTDPQAGSTDLDITFPVIIN